MTKDYDVIIIGGGTSGTMAAIAAARNGADVLLVEKNGYLGGVMTGAGVGPMMTFHAGDEQVIQGIMGELVERLQNKGMSPGHIADSTGFTYTVTPFDNEGLKVEEEQMVMESGADLLFHTSLADVKVDNNRIKEVILCNKNGLESYRAKVYIDATGDADLSVWSGVEYTKGRHDGKMQPLTLMLKMNNVDIDKVKEYVVNNPDQFPRLNGNTEQVVKANRLSLAGFTMLFEEAKQKKMISTEREDILFFETNTPGEVIFNTSRILNCDGTDPVSLTKAEIEGRKQTSEIAAFVKEYIPGFENSKVVQTGPSVGVRGSRQIVGVYTLTTDDLIKGKRFEDRITVGGYPIDIHSPEGAGTDVVKMEWGHRYYIPYRTLVNDRIDNLITVGRCVSATYEAQAALRVSPIIGAVGQAGGTAAALVVNQEKEKTQDVDMDLLKNTLIEQGMYLS
ncbi:FAD-dependent oxidoreductase [Vallitaleaceae bacterium 9-2]